jgi:hypothetical protein
MIQIKAYSELRGFSDITSGLAIDENNIDGFREGFSATIEFGSYTNW